MASVPNSYAQSNGASFEGAHSDGRVCELSPDKNGMKASEKFLAYDETKLLQFKWILLTHLSFFQ
jgi:hypothetical protein